MTAADQSRAAPLAEPQIQTRKQPDLMRQQRFWGWVFLSPWLIGFTLLTAMPILFSFVLTFTDFALTRPDEVKFVGLQNWQRLLNDPQAIDAIGVTLRYALIAVPIGLFVPLSMALLLNTKRLWGKRFFRTLFYMPYMVPAVSAIFIWMSFLNGPTGWLNRILRIIGVTDPPNWLQDQNTILIGFLMIGLWGAGNAMLTMLATMQGVPTELYEAAEVDGASAWVRLIRITLPMISPVIFYNLVLSVIGLMQYFVVPWIATEGTGRPGNSAYFFNMHLYKTAFLYQDMGYGSTMAWLIFFVALVLTIILFSTSKRWVYYSSGD